MKIILLFFAISLLALSYADAGEFAAAKALIDSGVNCDSLNESQLEMIGDYLMEQMHPGPQHEAVERMMGGAGSESLRRAHMQMAEVLYCGYTDTPLTFGGMMGMMPVMGGFGGGMMSWSGYGPGSGMMGYGSMMGYGTLGWLIDFLFWLLVIVVLLLALIWLYKNVTNSGRGTSAVDILKQRYAKGEITKEQYEKMKKEIG